MKRIPIVVGLLSGAVAVGGFTQIQLDSAAARHAAPDSGARSKGEDTITQTSMRNVNFYLMPNGALRIRKLRGTVRSLKGGPVVFDDKTSETFSRRERPFVYVNEKNEVVALFTACLPKSGPSRVVVQPVDHYFPGN